MLDSSSSSSLSSIDCSIISRNSSMLSSSSSSSSSSSTFSYTTQYGGHTFQDHSVHWGRGPVVTNLSQPDCIENCCMQKDHLITVCNKLWPRMRHLFEGNKNSIKCENRYNTHFKRGIIILLYRMSCSRCLHLDMEQSLKMRKSKLSSIIHTFSAALYQFTTPF